MLLASALFGCLTVAAAVPAPFGEPAAAVAEFIAVDPGKPGLHVQINFPPAASAGPNRQSYWLTGAEPLVIDVQLAAGPDGPAGAIEVRGTLLVDAQQVAVAIDGGSRGANFRRMLRPGTVDRFVARLPGTRIPRGAHTASLLFWRSDGRPFPSVGFNVFKGGTTFEPRRRTPGVTTVEGSRTGTSGLIGGAPPALLVGTPLLLENGRAPVRLFMERYDGVAPQTPLGVSFVAFVDGRQVPLGALGLRPHVPLTGDQRAEAPFFVAVDPPSTGVLTVFALPGDGAARESEGRPTAAMLNPQQLGAARLTR